MTTAKSKVVKTETQMPYLVALDVGFGGMKYLSSASSTPNIIPSAVLAGRKPSENRFFNSDTVDPENLVISTEEGTYFVGQHALNIPTQVSKRTQVRDRANDSTSRVLFHTGIGLSLPHKDGDYEVYLVTGLPNEDYELTVRDNLDAFVNHPFTITFHLSAERTITKNITIVGVDIVRQPEGAVTYHQFIFNPETFIAASQNARSMVGIIDVGHFTTDFSLFEKGIMMEDDRLTGSTVAVTEVYNRLKRKIFLRFEQEGYSYKPDDKDLDQIIRTGSASYVGKEFDVSQQVEEAAREVASMIAKEVLDTWGNETNRLETILLSGGGAYVVSQYLEEEFAARRKQGFHIMNSPQYANVLGFYMYGCFSLTQRFEKNSVLDTYVRPAFIVGGK